MNLIDFSIKEFLGIIFAFGFFIYIFIIIFNGIGIIKNLIIKK